MFMNKFSRKKIFVLSCQSLFFCLSIGFGSLYAADDPDFIELKGHTTQVWFACFSPDGKKVATSGGIFSISSGCFALIWDAESGKNLTKMEGHTGAIHSVVFSPDNKKILTAGLDGTPRIWDVESGKELQKLSEHNAKGGSSAFFSSPSTSLVFPSEFSCCWHWIMGTFFSYRRAILIRL